ncbi:GGDEF domain-containing protein [Herminiimonas sp. CN]|uniref:GGDEF domain-containing protein n=1 Tax=Herminiimonas sp. CN TaxID=1349818 RepID=UPI00047442FC|nr:GGDEF domain-containing protein [Herminiimonas sp. CN]
MNPTGPGRFDVEAIFDAVNLGLMIVDADGYILLWNEWIAKRSNIERADALNAQIIGVFSEPLAPAFRAAIKNTLTYGLPAVLSNALHRCPLPLYDSAEMQQSGIRMHQSITITPIRSRLGERCCLIQVADASISIKREKVLRSHSEVLRRETITDSLTGIYNRRFFDEHYKIALGHAKRQSHTLSVFVVDIDHFKEYNDYYQHLEGDRALRRVAKALKSQLSRATDVAARYGGEEFVLVLPSLSAPSAADFAEKLRCAVLDLAIPHLKSNTSDLLTVSIGFCTWAPDTDCDPVHLLHRADAALYRAKQKGRNQAVAFTLAELEDTDTPPMGKLDIVL